MTKPRGSHVAFTVRFDPADVSELDQLAQEQERSRAFVVRRLVAARLEQLRAQTAPQRPRPLA